MPTLFAPTFDLVAMAEHYLHLVKRPPGAFVGLAVHYGSVDDKRDLFKAGACSESAALEAVPVLATHDVNQQIGACRLMETPGGVLALGVLDIKNSRGAQAYEWIKKGVARGLSVGYVISDYEREQVTYPQAINGRSAGGWEDVMAPIEVRVIRRAGILEVSLVPNPQNRHCQVLCWI